MADLHTATKPKALFPLEVHPSLNRQLHLFTLFFFCSVILFSHFNVQILLNSQRPKEAIREYCTTTIKESCQVKIYIHVYISSCIDWACIPFNWFILWSPLRGNTDLKRPIPAYSSYAGTKLSVIAFSLCRSYLLEAHWSVLLKDGQEYWNILALEFVKGLPLALRCVLTASMPSFSSLFSFKLPSNFLFYFFSPFCFILKRKICPYIWPSLT